MLYLIRDPAENIMKIGYTKKSAYRRRGALQTAHSRVLEILWKGPGELRDEAALHMLLDKERLRGEWFADSDVFRLIRVFLKSHGAQWVIQQPRSAWESFVITEPVETIPLWHRINQHDAANLYYPEPKIFWPKHARPYYVPHAI